MGSTAGLRELSLAAENVSVDTASHAADDRLRHVWPGPVLRQWPVHRGKCKSKPTRAQYFTRLLKLCSRVLLPAAQENVSVISDLYQVPIFEKLPVLGERASVAPVAALTWSMATYFQAPEAGSCWYW